MKAQAIPPRLRFEDNNGLPLSGGKVYTYAAGTSTPQTTWTDSTGNTANANPIILDSRGEADIWLGELTYKFVTKDANEVEIDTTDNVSTSLVLSLSGGSANVGFIGAGTGAAATTVEAALREWVRTTDRGVDGTGVTDSTTAFNNARAQARAQKRALYISGTPRITAPLVINSREHWIFEGAPGNASGVRPQSYLIKASTVSGPLITFEGTASGNSTIERGGILGENGNTGDGILIKSNGVVLDLVYVEGCGQDGFRVGVDASGTGINANSVLMNRPVAQINGRHGIYLSEGVESVPANCNAITLIAPFAQNNAQSGIQVDNCHYSLILNPLCEANTGWGLNLGLGSDITVVGGDLEHNVAGNLYQAESYKNTIINVDVGGRKYSTWLDLGVTGAGTNATNSIENHNFADSLVWVLQGGASIASNKVTLPASSSAYQRITVVAGVRYTLKVTVVDISNRGVIQVSGIDNVSNELLNVGYITTSGLFEYSFVASTSSAWIKVLNDSGASGSWGVSIVEVYGDVITNGMMMPRQAPTASLPPYIKGAIIFDSTTNKLLIGGATTWETITSA